MLLYQLMRNQQSHSLSLLLFLIITFFFVIISFSLIVLFTYFEITLWMVTYWTYLRCLCSYTTCPQLRHSHTLTSLFSNTCAVSIFLRSARYLSSWCFSICLLSINNSNNYYCYNNQYY